MNIMVITRAIVKDESYDLLLINRNIFLLCTITNTMYSYNFLNNSVQC